MKDKTSCLLSSVQVKSIQLDILKDIDSFCHREGLTYFLGYGSALGAIRHNGFIPWDDDIDLIMPRPDYDRFVSTYHSDENEVLNLAESHLCVEMFAKVSRKGTKAEDSIGRSLWGVFVDIFPIDPLPDIEGEFYYRQMSRMNDNIPKVCPFYKAVSKRKILWFLKYVAKRLIYIHLSSVGKIKENISKKLRETVFGTAAKSGAYFGAIGLNEFMDTEIFKEKVDVDFEGRKYPVPKKYDAYLKHLYGDYMTLPPVSERESNHDYVYYNHIRP